MVREGVGLVYDERMCAHANLDEPFHPEKPARITSIFKSLQSSGIVERCERVEARDATPAELASVHTEEHIVRMCSLSSKKYGKVRRAALARGYNSIYFNEGSSSSALLAAGSVVELSLRVARGDLRAGAAVVRPPGHHAEAGAAMGFCLFNNVAVAAHVLVHGNPDLGVHKILIVDWDVHHGNGTQHMFWRDPQVLYFSIHRYDCGQFYPGGDDGNHDKVGEDKGAGFNVNVPWPHGGFGDLDYLTVFDHVLMPIAQNFKPDLVLVSGGFDSASGDPLGRCEVTPAGYSQMTNRLMGLANGRVVLALEGGYNLKSISDSYVACMKVLLGGPPEKVISKKHHISSTLLLVNEIRYELQQYWSVLSSKDEANSIDDNKGISVPAREVGEVSADDESAEKQEERKLLFTEPQRGETSPVDLIGPLSRLTAGGQHGEVNELVEAFHDALTLDMDNNEVTANCRVDNGHLAKTDASIEENASPEGVKSAVNGNVSSSGSVEVGDSTFEELKNICPQGPLESTSRTAIIDDHFQENSVGHDGGKPKSTEDNLGSIRSHDVTLLERAGLQDVASLESSGCNDSPDHKDAELSYVWYACYGSNLSTARFMCYIKGGQVEGMGKVCIGARNRAPPVASRWAMVPHNVFFGHTLTSTWGSGGVAFLDPVSHGGPPTTHVRLYKIRFHQLCDLLIQENEGDPNNSQLLIEWEHVDKLRCSQSATSHSTFDILEDAWYGTLKYLGDKDGLPILTITSSLKNMRKFRDSQIQVCPPSESYRAVILRGLLEHEILSKEECEAYIDSISGGVPEDNSTEEA